MLKAKLAAKRAMTDHDDWCLVMSQRLSMLNSKAADFLAESLVAMSSTCLSPGLSEAPDAYRSLSPGMSEASDAYRSLSPGMSEASEVYGSHALPSPSPMHDIQIQLGPRRKRSKYITNSCSECRLKKRKCSNVRPCAMCIVTGTGAVCQSESETAPFYTIIRGTHEALFQDARDQEIALDSLRQACLQVGVNIAMVRGQWELGLNASRVFKAFKILPLDLKLAIDEAIDTVKSAVLGSSRVLPGDLDAVRRMQDCGRLSHDLRLDEDSEGSSSRGWGGVGEWFDDAASNARWGHGRWVSMEFDSEDLAHCRRLRLGDEVAELLGYDAGEMLSRHSNHEMLLQVSEYEMLVAAIESLFHSLDREVTWYSRVTRPQRGPDEAQKGATQSVLYLRCTQHKAFDHAGRQKGYVITMDMATAEAFQRYKNGYLPPSMRMSAPEKNVEEAVGREAIVYMRKSQTAGAEKLSFLTEVVRRRTRDLKLS
ncbi:hypothetical protein GUITHDRAFT_105309 [Guillardia theta CCMP2712]|uniref:Zn(2)-C6 fungal-type domain-containing protein n=1 Tax=Guillardia theta (strain CCMP2712) TaxID=905079 RepID=L1JKR3_GUITC|nr:hypothetical protein GUITHDRAFT_105309 [Guillardia theta CCMP2712]EKX48675.1 hypothetical protein GUITHDRAFT_105309 [Guillardia theta CCMP2712]|eukprot:XP_005835655.1 hypothetical protein GUITHDRAFT_105309 [Guillardia theta CCMP2712]